MIKEEYKNILRTTFDIGQLIIFKRFESTLFQEYQEKLVEIKQKFPDSSLPDNLSKMIYEIEFFTEEKYTINNCEKLYYFFAAFRTHGLRFLTKNTYKHKVKRFVFETNFKLDYVQNLID